MHAENSEFRLSRLRKKILKTLKSASLRETSVCSHESRCFCALTTFQFYSLKTEIFRYLISFLSYVCFALFYQKGYRIAFAFSLLNSIPINNSHSTYKNQLARFQERCKSLLSAITIVNYDFKDFMSIVVDLHQYTF